jgi:hypothetical protein
LDELLADDFFEFAQKGTSHTKKDIIKYLPQANEEKFIMKNYTEKVISENTVLVNYVAYREILETKEKRKTLFHTESDIRKTIHL